MCNILNPVFLLRAFSYSWPAWLSFLFWILAYFKDIVYLSIGLKVSIVLALCFVSYVVHCPASFKIRMAYKSWKIRKKYYLWSYFLIAASDIYITMHTHNVVFMYVVYCLYCFTDLSHIEKNFWCFMLHCKSPSFMCCISLDQDCAGINIMSKQKCSLQIYLNLSILLYLFLKKNDKCLFWWRMTTLNNGDACKSQLLGKGSKFKEWDICASFPKYRDSFCLCVLGFIAWYGLCLCLCLVWYGMNLGLVD